MAKNEPIKIDEIDDSAAKAAQDEAMDVDQIPVEFQGKTYSVSRDALQSAQFRYQIQRARDAIAAEMLLGPAQFNQFLADLANDKGFTPSATMWEFLNAAGKELGTGNR